MNGYAVVVLAALLVELALEIAAELLNLRALGGTPPYQLRDAYEPARYRRTRDYLAARIRFGIVSATINIAALLAFWFAGGFGWLDESLRALGWGPIVTGLLFIGALGLARVVVALPLRWWSTFVLEERFGFNKTTPATFWADTLKGLVLAAALGAPLLAGILWLFETAGPSAWLWCWLVAASYSFVVQLVAPTWIMPLFNEFTALPDGSLRDRILAFARSVAFPLEGVFVIDGSRRSTKANAFFTGFGRHKRIALFDTLLASLDADQIVAVLAHEIGHYKRRHVVIGMVIGVLHMGLALFVLSRFLGSTGLFEAFSVSGRPVYAGLVFFALLFGPVDLLLSIAHHVLSRRFERQADDFAVATTGAGEPLAAALVRLSVDSLAHPSPHQLHVLLHHSHPPLLERIHSLRAPRPASTARGVPRPANAGAN
jgi:STE24 endopeptidase